MIRKNRMLEIFIVCILSGIGMIYSGHLLNQWKLTNYLKSNDVLWIIITPLLGLKGNLEMTLASRLATTAKLGGFKNPLLIGYNNLIITQIQGLLVGFCVSLIAGLFNALLNDDKFVVLFYQLFRLIFIGVLTASLACLILGVITILIVYICWRLNFDPDNIASPLAAALGDTVTLFILYFFQNLCPSADSVNYRHLLTLSFILLIALPFLISQLSSNADRSLLTSCLFSIFPAMMLSSLSGLVLKSYIFKIDYLATLQPIINGVGGNVASILCSSMATDCHRLKKYDNFKEKDLVHKCTQLRGFLIVTAVLTHTVLLLLENAVGLLSLSILIQLILPYFCAVLSQTLTLLYLAQYLITFMWQHNINPDNCSIPLITAFGDVIGTSILCILLSMWLQNQ